MHCLNQKVKIIWQETSGVNDWIWPKPFLALVVGRLSGVGAELISSGTLQLFVSQHFAVQEEIVTPGIGSEDNLLCASKQMRSCVVVQLKREESEEFYKNERRIKKTHQYRICRWNLDIKHRCHFSRSRAQVKMQLWYISRKKVNFKLGEELEKFYHHVTAAGLRTVTEQQGLYNRSFYSRMILDSSL